jgi:hypothetical protein
MKGETVSKTAKKIIKVQKNSARTLRKVPEESTNFMGGIGAGVIDEIRDKNK